MSEIVSELNKILLTEGKKNMKSIWEKILSPLGKTGKKSLKKILKHGGDIPLPGLDCILNGLAIIRQTSNKTIKSLVTIILSVLRQGRYIMDEYITKNFPDINSLLDIVYERGSTIFNGIYILSQSLSTRVETLSEFCERILLPLGEEGHICLVLFVEK